MVLVSSLCWKTDRNDYDLHDTTHSFGGGNLSTTSTNYYLQFLGCWESAPIYYYKTFGLGYYKFTVKVNNVIKDYFYIDYRTSDLPEHYNSDTEGKGDLKADFDVVNSVFYYYYTHDLFPTATSIWQQKSRIDSLTTELEPLPPDDFDLSSSGGHPYLTWNHSSNTGDYWTGYKIYREICAGGNPYFTEDDLTATVGKNTTSYTDQTYFTGHGWEGYYCIKAINGNRASDFTEVLEIDLDAFQKNNLNILDGYENNLQQNYPNPFNPLTVISFSLRDITFVTLKIYDVLGREVDVLVNEVLNEGNHQIIFNGSNFESGTYFYEISTNNFRDVKKFILIK